MKLKDTKLGQWLKEKAPQALEFVGDVLPDKGALGILKGVISKVVPPELSPEMEAQWHEFEMEILKIEVEDKQNARTREVDFVKATGHIDRFMIGLGIFIMIAFAFCMWVTVYVQLPESSREMFIEIRATMRDALIGIVSYYWGSSAGSRIKDMKK